MHQYEARGLRPKQATTVRSRCPLTGELLDDGGTVVVLETGDAGKRRQITFHVALERDAAVAALKAMYPEYTAKE